MGSSTGLVADFLQLKSGKWVSAKPNMLESQYDGQVSWNACRTPWRLAHYFAVTSDSRLAAPLKLMLQSLTTSKTTAGAKYPQLGDAIRVSDGARLTQAPDIAFAAPAAYLAHVLGDSSAASKGFAGAAKMDPSYFGNSIWTLIQAQIGTELSLWQ